MGNNREMLVKMYELSVLNSGLLMTVVNNTVLYTSKLLREYMLNFLSTHTNTPTHKLTVWGDGGVDYHTVVIIHNACMYQVISLHALDLHNVEVSYISLKIEKINHKYLAYTWILILLGKHLQYIKKPYILQILTYKNQRLKEPHLKS